MRSSYLRFTLVALTFLGVGCTKKPTPQPDHPRLTSNIILRDITFHSVALNRDMPYRVILPTNLPADRKLKVVYLLHGGGGGFRDWSNYSDVAQYSEQGFLLVMPEGASSYYVNAIDPPGDRYEDFIVHDLIADVESRFPVAPGRSNRAIAGVSMGGFGAMNLALRHPDLFAFAAGLSSAIDVPRRAFSWKRLQQSRHYNAIFGAPGSPTRRAQDPFVEAKTANATAAPYFFLTCGEQEGLLPSNREFANLLGQNHLPHEFHTVHGGHDWNQWNAWLPDMFRSLSKHLGPEH